jgi:hypothetical protein
VAVDFLWAAGTSNNGLIASALSLLTTELESVTSASVVQSSVGGSSGLFTNANTGQAIWGEIFYYPGNAGLTTGSGAPNLAGWFETTPDGTAFESSAAAPARPPDFIIPLPASTAIGGANNTVYKAAGLVRLPALKFYVLIQNNAGATLGAGGTSAPYIKLAPVAVQY